MGGDFLLGHLPFWLTVYGLAVVGWTLLGRWLLGLFVPADSPLYIWRAFRRLTDWAVRAVAWVTPQAVPPPLLVPIAAVWIFALRLAATAAMLGAGLAPRLSAATGAG